MRLVFALLVVFVGGPLLAWETAPDLDRARARGVIPLADPIISTGSFSISVGETVVVIRPDGTIEYGKGYKPDEAAKAFWDAVGVERKARNCQ